MTKRYIADSMTPASMLNKPEQSLERYSSYYKEGTFIMNANTTSKTFVGIDVSKHKIDIYVHPDATHYTLENNLEGFKKLIAMLEKIKPTLVVFEATGDYEHELMMAIGKANIPFHRINPRWTFHYAKGCRKLSKTDRQDAETLARYAAEHSPKPHKIPTEREIELRDLLKLHRQVKEEKARWKTRLHQAKIDRVKQEIEATIRRFEEQLKGLEQEIDALIQEDPEQQEKMEIIDSVPGLADQTARTLVIEASELGALSDAEVASMFGVAPMNHDSGRHKGHRYIQGGRAVVRAALYKALVPTVTRGYNPVLTEYYKRLIAAGKPFKVAMIACVRKLAIILNAMLRNRKKWQQHS